jgi:hypothetical protein
MRHHRQHARMISDSVLTRLRPLRIAFQQASFELDHRTPTCRPCRVKRGRNDRANKAAQCRHEAKKKLTELIQDSSKRMCLQSPPTLPTTIAGHPTKARPGQGQAPVESSCRYRWLCVGRQKEGHRGAGPPPWSHRAFFAHLCHAMR